MNIAEQNEDNVVVSIRCDRDDTNQYIYTNTFVSSTPKILVSELKVVGVINYYKTTAPVDKIYADPIIFLWNTSPNICSSTATNFNSSDIFNGNDYLVQTITPTPNVDFSKNITITIDQNASRFIYTKI